MQSLSLGALGMVGCVQCIDPLFSNNAVCSQYMAVYFFLNNPRETPIARFLGPVIGVFHEIIVWPKFHLRIRCTVCGIVLYVTAISRVYSIN